jgi:hypothetical protein
MPTPTGSDLHVSRPLSNLSVAYMQGNDDFIADKVFPPVPIEYQYGMYYTYTKGDWFRTQSALRAPRTESVGTGWTVGTDTYRAEVYAVHVDVSDQDRANQERGIFDLDRDATNLVTRDMMLRREKDWISAYFGTGKWTNTDQTGVAAAPAANQFLRWDLSSSTPIEDIEEQRVAMRQLTGFNPNVLVIGAQVYSAFKNHPEFIERIKYSQKGVVTLDLIANLLDVERVYMPNAIENTAADGATDAMSFLYGKSALLAYAAPNAGLMIPSAGYTFEWSGYMGSSRGTRVTKFRMEALKSDRIEIESAYDFNLVSADLGVFFTTAVS